MATQSLYRRYRPRRFSELKGQDHVVRALRTSVAEGREGQAYLFSGPRGTGKTTSARILAKVLNCHNPIDGEPCCECESCLSVEKGTSYDVHELDAASNNGVDAMRDLIEKASLGTPGRHKVYILDEVHMLSKGAEAALLKTLEEPPPHVVFVLATTDPQKMSDTIRSRTQHLQFHLLGPDTLQEHVRWVAADAGLSVTDEAIEQVIAQGAGSPRDTLSALELVANSGGGATEMLSFEEFVEAMIDSDPGRALTGVAKAISLGRDPRTVTEELIRFLRNGFLSLMAPELVQLPSQRLEALTELSRRLGAAGLVRGIELLGTALTEMRQAPDPRVLLDVVIVQLTSEQASTDVAALASRIQKLERQLADGGPRPAAPGPAPTSVSGSAPPPVSGSNAAAAPIPAEAGSEPDREATATERRRLGARAGSGAAVGGTEVAAPQQLADAPPSPAPQEATSEPVAEPAATVAPTSDASSDAAVGSGRAFGAGDWDAVRPTLRGMAKAVFSPAVFVSADARAVVLGLPNDAHRTKCEQHREVVEAAINAQAGASRVLELVVQGAAGATIEGASGAGEASRGEPARTVSNATSSIPSGPAPGDDPSAAPPERVHPTSGALAHAVEHQPDEDRQRPILSVVHDVVVDEVHFDAEPVGGAVESNDETAPTERPQPSLESSESVARSGREIAEMARAQGPQPDPEDIVEANYEELPADDEVDLDELTDVPAQDVKSPLDRLTEAFPGSVLVDEPPY